MHDEDPIMQAMEDLKAVMKEHGATSKDDLPPAAFKHITDRLDAALAAEQERADKDDDAQDGRSSR